MQEVFLCRNVYFGLIKGDVTFPSMFSWEKRRGEMYPVYYKRVLALSTNYRMFS
jgi:hypothetical protein